MFIKSIELENFSNIYSGLGTDRIFIDFKDQKNTVCVIVGRNGRGKTSLLSYLTPFATVGSLDDRDGNDVIKHGEKGYKRIIFIDDGGNEIEIEHFYTPSGEDKHTVKSYIKMNGNELNENGNVTSFKKIVADVLGIEMDYLKLIRVGDNVQNIIKAKPTERKTFMGKLLDEVYIYLKQHTQIVQKRREVKAVLGHLIDELSKTEISDLDESKKRLTYLDKNITLIQKDLDNAERDNARIQILVDEIGFSIESENQLKSLEDQKIDYEKALKKFDASGMNPNDIIKKINNLSEKNHEFELRQVELTTKKEHLISLLDTEFETLETNRILLEKEEKETNISSLLEYEKTLELRVNTLYRSAFDDLQLNCTKDEFEEFVVFLKNTQNILNITYEFGKEPIREVLKEMEKNRDVQEFITSSLVLLESKQRAERMSIIDRLISKYSSEVSCKEACPYKSLHKELMEIRDAKPVSKVEHDAEFYHMMKLAYDNISNVFESFKEQKSLIQKMPTDIQKLFTIESLFDRIGKCVKIYDDKIINEYLAFFNEYSTYKTSLNELTDLKKEIEHLKNVSKVDYFKMIIADSQKKIETYKSEISDLESNITLVTETLSDISSELGFLEKVKDAAESLSSIDDKIKELVSQKERYLEALSNHAESSRKVNNTRETLNQITKERYKLQSNIERYKSLTKEIDKQKEIYDDYEHLAYALSNKKGIPLVYIEMFLKDTRDIANELLDIVYGGSLYLSKFDIGADEFRMPYVKNGKKISDVSSSSQGEQSFFNMAISSALRCQAMTRYNIALYDEVDSMFDDSNRQRFIPVLERQLEINNVNQAFLITHNQMFQRYPVDIINLDNPEQSTVSLQLG